MSETTISRITKKEIEEFQEKVKKAKTLQSELKAKFLEYYRNLPVQKLAAEWINRSPDTIQNWMKEDEEFSAQVNAARADWATRTSKQVRSKEWLLERVMKDEFAQRTEYTGANGGDLKVSLVSYDKPDDTV